jgi:hypothetical protein
VSGSRAAAARPDRDPGRRRRRRGIPAPARGSGGAPTARRRGRRAAGGGGLRAANDERASCVDRGGGPAGTRGAPPSDRVRGARAHGGGAATGHRTGRARHAGAVRRLRARPAARDACARRRALRAARVGGDVARGLRVPGRRSAAGRFSGARIAQALEDHYVRLAAA